MFVSFRVNPHVDSAFSCSHTPTSAGSNVVVLSVYSGWSDGMQPATANAAPTTNGSVSDLIAHLLPQNDGPAPSLSQMRTPELEVRNTISDPNSNQTRNPND